MDENARKGKNEDPAAPMGTNIHYGESTRIQKIHDEMKVWLKNLEFRGALKSYNALDVSDFHHMRINHSNLFADKQNHINGIENFWNQAKRHLRKFNGIKSENFYWFLKECEWRFNGGDHKELLSQLKHWHSDTKH